MNVGIAPRADRQPGESDRVLHAPPVIPGDKETFTCTATIPTPYVQVNLSYGNSIVTGNISLLAEQPSVSAGYFDPPLQAGINDVFLDLRPRVGKNARLHGYVGPSPVATAARGARRGALRHADHRSGQRRRRGRRRDPRAQTEAHAPARAGHRRSDQQGALGSHARRVERLR